MTSSGVELARGDGLQIQTFALPAAGGFQKIVPSLIKGSRLHICRRYVLCMCAGAGCHVREGNHRLLWIPNEA